MKMPQAPTVAANDTEQPPLTVAGILALRERVLGIGRKDSWRVSALFAKGKVTVCHKVGESFYLVHPETFPALAAAYYRNQTPKERRNPLLGLNAIHLDPQEDDDEGRAAWRLAERMRVTMALADSILRGKRETTNDR